MAKRLNISFDSDLLEAISSEFDLRAPNKEALRNLIFTLNGSYDPDTMQVLNLATGVGKTYLMAAFIEYLRQQGVGNVVIVTPGKTVQAKTVQNFTPGSPRYITGSQVPPDVVTPQNYSAWIARSNGAECIQFGRETPMLAFIFNIQQLIAPKNEEGSTNGSTQDATRRKPRKFDENAGVLFDYLKSLDDLVVIADESHLYSSSAAAFHAALKELDPAATVGLTASVNVGDHVIYKYPLYKAIQDQFVKVPVLAFRKGGYGEDAKSEEQQLRDALQLRTIKQAYYDSYALQEKKQRVNAVLFVVCSDVDHASQVSNLLRGPEYFDSETSVLQVDSKHDDETTQRLLEDLDQPSSPVLAVVSVNKLKEGWDVKNIAVIVTLRAMASEVLTQQTMGRGLRLPFGKYTGVWQIDQLDIISHQSFQELLTSENVLAQFGLEEALPSASSANICDAIAMAANEVAPSITKTSGEEENCQGASNTESGIISSDPYFAQPSHIETSEGSSTIGIRVIDEPETKSGNNEITLEVITVNSNPRYENVSYYFPATTIDVVPPTIDLADIEDESIEQAAKKVSSSGDVLYRKEIVAAIGGKLRAQDAESAEIDSIAINADNAAIALARLVSNMQMVPANAGSIRYIRTYLVPKFMKAASQDPWTVKSLDSAKQQLQELIKDYIQSKLRSVQSIQVIHPVKMPKEASVLPLGERVHEPIDSRKDFIRGRYYSGWFKSLFLEESFDSFSGEYELARLLNTSPKIEWWHRLHVRDAAYIYYNSKDRYFPDFVAKDTDGACWIIEAKDKRGRDDAIVQEKRKAAETLVRKLASEDCFSDQTWGYLIAYEDDIALSDSWDDLKGLAQPSSNAI